MPLGRISLTLSRLFYLSFIASGRSSGLNPISSHTCCMYVRAGRPAFAWPYAGFHRSTSLMSSSLLLQQCPACLVRLAWIVFMMGGRWPYSWCPVACCRQDLFNLALNNLQWLIFHKTQITNIWFQVFLIFMMSSNYFFPKVKQIFSVFLLRYKFSIVWNLFIANIFLNLTKTFVLRLFKMVANQSRVL